MKRTDPEQAAQEWEAFMVDIGYDQEADGSWKHCDDGHVVTLEEARQERHEYMVDALESSL